MLPVVILAGGLATRLQPVTNTIPKSLVTVAGQPFIFHQLEYLRSQGVRQVTLCVGHLGELIEEQVGNGGQFGLSVTYSTDAPKLLGTGGALKLALPLLGEFFFILYGDSYLPIDFQRVEDEYSCRAKPALMTILKNDDRWDKSNVHYHEGILVNYDKGAPSDDMKYVDYGLGIMAGNVLTAYPTGAAFDLADVYHDLATRGELAGYEVHERFFEIGSHTGLSETETYLSARRK